MAGSLTGKRIVITRPRQQCARVLSLLRERGAEPIVFSTIAVERTNEVGELDRQLGRLEAFDWLVLTSAQASALVLERWGMSGRAGSALGRTRIAVLGEATAAPLRRAGVAIALVSTESRDEGLVASLSRVHLGAGKRLLVVQSLRAKSVLTERLASLGAILTVVHPYTVIAAKPDAAAWEALRRGFDAVFFTSSSTVDGFFTILGREAMELLGRRTLVAIGPSTAAYLEERGLVPQVVAKRQSDLGMIEALEGYWRQ